MRTGRFVAPPRDGVDTVLVRTGACWRQQLPWMRAGPLPKVWRLRLTSGPCHAGSWPLLPVRRGWVRRSARLPPAFEHLNDDHASAAAGAWRPEVFRFVGIAGVGRGGDVQEFAGERKAGLAGATCQQAVMPDAMEATRQDITTLGLF